MHCVHIKIESERWATAMVRASCGINNKQTKRTKQKMKMIFSSSGCIKWIEKLEENAMKKRARKPIEIQMNTANNEHQFGRLFRLWFHVWCCACRAIIVVGSSSSSFTFISNACNVCIDKWKRSGFFLFLSSFFPIQFISPALDLNRWTRSIELNGQKLIVMLNWLVVNSFWYHMHSGTPIDRWLYFVIARSHGFVRNP